MREIKFRGKRLDNGEWIYGCYFYKARYDMHVIKPTELLTNINEFDIDLETLGQFTGLKDKNGKEIYKDDICHTYQIDVGNLNRQVIFSEGSFCFEHKYCLTTELRGFKQDYIEIIGNIHDNPKLL